MFKIKLFRPRKRFDINFYIFFKLFLSLFTFSNKKSLDKLRTMFSGGGDREVLPFLSVRSAFDAYLSALSLPKDSEIILSAVTIPDMVTIIEEHSLIPVAIDIDTNTMLPDVSDLKSKINDKTKMFLFTHLFGSVSDITEIVLECKKRNMIVVEDCAQAFMGADYLGHFKSDVVFWSFGPLKTATSLLGAVATFAKNEKNNTQIIKKVCEEWRAYKRLDYLKRIFKFGILHVLSYPIIFTFIVWIMNLLRIDYGALIHSSTRSFKKEDLFKFIRRRPGTFLINAMSNRLSKYKLWRVEKREKSGMKLIYELGIVESSPCMKTVRHSFWLLPIFVRDVNLSSNFFISKKIDIAKTSSSLVCVNKNKDGSTPNAERIVNRTISFHFTQNGKRDEDLINSIGNNIGDFTIHKCNIRKKLNICPEHNNMFVGYTSECVYPKSAEELSEIIKMHIRENKEFTVVGNSKSHGGHTVYNNITRIDMSLMNKVFEINKDNKYITVEAGVKWVRVLRELNKVGMSPLTMQSSNDFSIGGSIAGGIHGRSIKNAYIADAVIEIEYVDLHSGEVKNMTKNDDMFGKIVAGQGWVGIITKAKLKIVENHVFESSVELLKTSNIPSKINSLLEYEADVFFMCRPIVSIFYAFKYSTTYIWKEKINERACKSGLLNDSEKNVLRDKVIFRISVLSHIAIFFRNIAEYILGKVTIDGKRFCRNQLFCPPVTPLRFLYSSATKRREHTQEFFVPVDNYIEFCDKLSFFMKKYKIMMAGMTIRFIEKNQETNLSPSHNSDVISVMCYVSTRNIFGDVINTKLFIQDATETVIKLKGAPFLSYAFQQKPSSLFVAYTNLKGLVEKSKVSSRFLTNLKSNIE